MHVCPDTMAYIFAKNAVAIWFHIAFDSMTDVAYGVAHHCLLDAGKKCAFRSLNQLHILLVCVAYRNGDTGVTHVTI